MTPMAGIGANTALRDADLLRRKLIGATDVIAAIGEYETEMLGYGFAAVRRSLRNAKQAGSANRPARHGFRGFLRARRRHAADQEGDGGRAGLIVTICGFRDAGWLIGLVWGYEPRHRR